MKKIIVLLILLLPFNIYASTNTSNRENLDNLGVNKHWNITNSNRDNVLNTYLVDAKEKIYDFGDILTEEEEKEIYNEFSDFVSKYQTDLVFLTVDLPYSYDSVNEDYAADFYDYNDFGIDFSNYSGILLLRNTYESDPYYNMYMFGNAQLYIDWDRSEYILDSIYDDFHSHRYLSGLKTYISLLNSYYERGIAKSKEDYIIDENGYLQKVYHTPFKLIIVISLMIDSIVMLILVKKNKMVKTKLYVDSYIDRRKVNINHKEDRFIRTHTSSYTVSSSSGGGGGGGHSSSGSSGGGHSSGGGRHG